MFIGVYYVNNCIFGFKLFDFYGIGVLLLFYFNEWDKCNGCSGYGIWLYGMFLDNFSCLFLFLDGCVVLVNLDL